MIRILFLVLFFVLAFPAQAAATYFCRCDGVGADPACVAGSDANTGATTVAGGTGPKLTVAAIRTAWAAAVAGDQILLCKGGAWDGFSILYNANPHNSTFAQYKANPLIFGSFTPTQFASTQKPRLNTPVNYTTTATLTGVTKANPGVVTATNTFSNGDIVSFSGVTGMPELNGMQVTVSSVSGAGFTMKDTTGQNLDTSTFTAAGTAGTITKSCPYNDIGAGACVAFNLRSSTGTDFGGYVFQDLEIQGGADTTGNGWGTQGFVIMGPAKYITIQRVTFKYLDSSVGGNTSGGFVPLNVTVRNNDISYMLGNGMSLFAMSNLLVEGNTLDHTAYGPKQHSAKIRDHAMYISGNQNSDATNTLKSYGNVIRDNIITNTAYGKVGSAANAAQPTSCSAVVLAGHARLRDWTIEGNQIIQLTGTYNGGCYGIGMTQGNLNGPNYAEYDERLTIRGNLIVNVGNYGILLSGCIPCTVENNVLVQTDTVNGYSGISVVIQMNGGNSTPITPSVGVVIRNNSLYMGGGTGAQGAVGIDPGGSDSTGYLITNNLMKFGAGGSVTKCFTYSGSIGYTTWGNNICYNATTWATGYGTKALFTTATGFDANSLTTDPLLVNDPVAPNYSMQILLSSPAKDAGHATLHSQNAYQGYPAVGIRDIGAYEYGSNP